MTGPGCPRSRVPSGHGPHPGRGRGDPRRRLARGVVARTRRPRRHPVRVRHPRRRRRPDRRAHRHAHRHGAAPGCRHAGPASRPPSSSVFGRPREHGREPRFARDQNDSPVTRRDACQCRADHWRSYVRPTNTVDDAVTTLFGSGMASSVVRSSNASVGVAFAGTSRQRRPPPATSRDRSDRSWSGPPSRSVLRRRSWIAGTVKSAYDLALWHWFSRVTVPDEQSTVA